MRALLSEFETRGEAERWLERAMGPRGGAEAEVTWVGGARGRGGGRRGVWAALRAAAAGLVGLVGGVALGTAVVGLVVAVAAVAWVAVVGALGAAVVGVAAATGQR